ncbi:elongation factor Ts, mitochondrial isoform X2 [Macadamia integrifolia]|uniref:elongation factor Ts, mitochondrial isoform X2 n=1 Tax=Macadamia integrifolia TaxID=60698 RepID=UPI001C4E6AFF|nr:elongation factor Ts, mitochondrial isoform X2 [Macadamia integrifolia]
MCISVHEVFFEFAAGNPIFTASFRLLLSFDTSYLSLFSEPLIVDYVSAIEGEKEKGPIFQYRFPCGQMAFARSAKSSFGFLLNRIKYSMHSGHCYCSSAHREAYIAGVIRTKSLFTSQSASPSPHKSFKRSFSGGVPASEQMNLIKLLRERTSAPIKAVKSALVDSNWDIEAAQKDLRKRGVVLASKKSSRTATEGLLALAQTENKAAIIELNCETDFVARNEIFQCLALSLARIALSVDCSAEQVSTAIPIGSEYLECLKINLDHPKLSGETTVQSAITEVAAIMGENVTLRRGFQMSSSAHGVVSSYLHSSPQPGLGRIAGVLTLEVEDDNAQLDALQEVGSQLAMHIVAAKPLFLSKELVSNEAIESERDILKSQAESSGKPQMAIEKMVEGRLRKYFEDVVFMEQKFVVNDTINVKSLLSDLSKKVGSPVKIGNFFRMEVGEGIQRLETSSTSEVVAQAA